MNDTNLLIGSLSNDLFRVATLAQRGSVGGATRFLAETKRWTQSLKKVELDGYIENIVKEVDMMKVGPISLALAEKLLMYGVLLQNYSSYKQ